MKINDHVAIFDGAISEEICKDAIKWFEQTENEVISSPEELVKRDSTQVRSGGFSNGLSNRKDTAYFLETDARDFAQGIRDKIISGVNACVKEYMIEYPALNGYKLFNIECKVQKTPPHGGYHIWHHEHSSQPNSMSRILVWTVYLNDIPDGEGETEFIDQGIKCGAKMGRVCVFPASFTHPHRGNPPYSCDKYIATGWIHCSPQD